ncbi:pseudouridine synthase [Maribacter sp. 2210JD10-5]|uniref:RluA family pseudouridine synthase n=1 Tax=Maribacter sp. 2210JD10-5 TaxID=3386272 RepID=UPI0039BD75E3
MQTTPIRLQEYGVGIFKMIPTKSALKKAIKTDLIWVDGNKAKTGTFITGGERIELLENIKPETYKRLNFSLEVVYEDDYLAVINKPAGILVSGNKFETVANALAQNLKKSTQLDAVQPQPVHRLDYPTTGLLLVGKTSGAILALNKLFEQKEVVKTYFAVTIGETKPKGTIKTPINAKEALSEYEVLQTLNSERFKCLNLVKLSPKTGRRHQLRKHLSGVGNPILGDAEYGLPHLILKGKGLYLHAQSLEFIHPFAKNRIVVESKLPKKFGKLFLRE